jgi:hypothetical protein
MSNLYTVPPYKGTQRSNHIASWLALTARIMITSHITMARRDKRPPRALLEAIVANLIFGALLVLRSM